MKIYIYLLLVGLFSGQLTVLAQQPERKIVNLEIQSDTTIIVRNLFNANCKLYGDKIVAQEDKTKIRSTQDGAHKDTVNYITYGGNGNLFANKSADLNKENSKYIIKNDKGDISISFKYNELPDNTFMILFYGVKYDGVLTQKTNSKGVSYMGSKEWYCDSNVIYCLNITKKSDIETSQEVSDVGPVSEKSKDNNKGQHIGLQDEMLGIALAILIIICLIIVILIRINRLKKRIDRCEVNKPSRKSEDIDKIRHTIISKINSTDLVQRISNDDIYNLINRSDIQLYIQSVIVGKVEEYLRNKVNVPTPPVVETPVQSTNIAKPALRTTKIEYQSDNNSFVISENSSNKIFEMYSSNGEYYYTIVNDSSIKKEMLGFITAFAKYVETRQDSPIPSTVEVIRDGHLIKNGDMYIVDANCLLQVSLR